MNFIGFKFVFFCKNVLKTSIVQLFLKEIKNLNLIVILDKKKRVYICASLSDKKIDKLVKGKKAYPSCRYNDIIKKRSK